MIPLLLVSLLGCPKPAEPPPSLVATPPPPEAPLAGAVTDGAFRDARLPLVVPLPPEWTARVGLDADPLRVALADPVSGAVVEVRVADDVVPMGRDGCDWTFVDDAPYRVPGAPGVVRVATCTPLDARAPRVFGVFVLRGGRGWHFEAVVPPGRLLAGRAALDEVLARARYGG